MVLPCSRGPLQGDWEEGGTSLFAAPGDSHWLVGRDVNKPREEHTDVKGDSVINSLCRITQSTEQRGDVLGTAVGH